MLLASIGVLARFDVIVLVVITTTRVLCGVSDFIIVIASAMILSAVAQTPPLLCLVSLRFLSIVVICIATAFTMVISSLSDACQQY